MSAHRLRMMGWMTFVALLGTGGLYAGVQMKRDATPSIELPSNDPPQASSPCPDASERAPVRLLALGQSNAANHGENLPTDISNASNMVRVHTRDGCRLVSGPLPGGTGEGGNIWTYLPSAFKASGLTIEPEMAVIAIDGSRVAQWSSDHGALATYIDSRLVEISRSNWRPDFVLWQQGEADARDFTSTEDYLRHFETVRQKLRTHGIAVPILLARSTYCRNEDGRKVREAIDVLQTRHPDLLPGADTDSLQGEARFGPCHLSRSGLQQAAILWSAAIKAAKAAESRLPSRPTTRPAKN